MTTGLVLVELILFQFGGAQDAKRGVPSDARSESPSEASLPPKPTDDLNDVAWRGYHTAFAWLMESRKAEAVEILGLLVSRYPEHPSAERSQRVLDTMEGRATQPRGMEARENDPWSRYHLAFEALARGDKKRSRVTLEEIVTFNPKTAVGVRSRKVLAVPDRDPANFARRTGPAGGPARIPSEPRRGQKDRSTSARFQLGLRAAYMTLPGTDNYYDASADRPSSPTVGADLGLRLGNWLLAAVLDRAIMFREGHMTRANLSVQHFFEAGCLNECDNNSFWLGAAMGIRRSSVAERASTSDGSGSGVFGAAGTVPTVGLECGLGLFGVPSYLGLFASVEYSLDSPEGAYAGSNTTSGSSTLLQASMDSVGGRWLIAVGLRSLLVVPRLSR